MTEEAIAQRENASAIQNLRWSIEGLTDYRQFWKEDRTSGSDTGSLVGLYQKCNKISEYLRDANSSLSDGWRTSAKLFYKLYMIAYNTLEEMYDDILVYTDESLAAEREALKAVETANESAHDIISELDSLVGGAGSSSSSPAPSSNSTNQVQRDFSTPGAQNYTM